MYYKSDGAGHGIMPTNHHHGHAHVNNKDKGYVISTHSVITSSLPPSPASLNTKSDQNIEASSQPSVGFYQRLSPDIGTAVSGTVSSSTTSNRGGGSSSSTNMALPNSGMTVSSSPSRLSTLLLSTSSLRGANSSTTQPSQAISGNVANQTSSQPWSASESTSSANDKLDNSGKSNEATQKNLLLKQLLNVSFPSSASVSSAAAAAAAAQAAAAAAASSATSKADILSAMGTNNPEKSPSPPSSNSRILQLLSQNNDSLQKQKNLTNHQRLSDRSQSYGLQTTITNLNRQPPNVTNSIRPIASSSSASMSTITSAENPLSGEMHSIKTVGGGNSNNILVGGSGRQSLKRAASDPLGGGTEAKQQQATLSAVCSENPSLASLLSKPPAQASRTVPPPVPTKWHQEPKEKLPRDIMRKFLPPHPAERSSSSSSASKSKNITGLSSLLQTVSQPASSPSQQDASSATLSPSSTLVAPSSNSGDEVSVTPVSMSSFLSNSSSVSGSSNSVNSLNNTSLATRDTTEQAPDNDDPMLDAILNDVIEIQEKSPPLAVGQSRVVGHKRTHNRTLSNNYVPVNSSSNTDSISSPASAALLAEHSQISDIEKYLASAENTPPRENSPQRNDVMGGSETLRNELNPLNKKIINLNQPTSQVTAIKSLPPPPPTSSPSSSTALSSPSLTSILSAPPIAAMPVPMRNIMTSNRNMISTSSGMPAAPNLPRAASKPMPVTKGGSLSTITSQDSTTTCSNSSSTLLVPRMNDLLNVPPPNVSLPECPDMSSLIHLQNAEQENQRRRRISSGQGGMHNRPTVSTNTSSNMASGSCAVGNNQAIQHAWQGNNRMQLSMPTSKSSVTQQNLLIAQQATRATNGNRLSSPSVSSPASIPMLQSPSSSSGAPQAGMALPLKLQLLQRYSVRYKYVYM